VNTVLTEPVGMQAIDSRQSPRYKAAVMFWFSMFIGITINPLPLLLGPKPRLVYYLISFGSNSSLLSIIR
jgi:antibiotic biosynthesis monooxygenase (ABM) superfamily enzyme